MMKTYAVIAAVILATAGSCIPVVAAPGPLHGLAGHWRVIGVAVSNSGAQALADNDPSLMGRGLSFTPAGLGWDQPTPTKDSCLSPRFERLDRVPPVELEPQLRKLGMPRPTFYAVRCRAGSWGPDTNATLFLGRGGVIAMPWYDGGLLKLTR